MADGVEPLRHEPREVGLAGAEDFGHRLHAAGEFGGRTRQRGHLNVEVMLALGCLVLLVAARAGRRGSSATKRSKDEQDGRRGGRREADEAP